MALIVTTGSLIQQYNAFTGLSALERSQSGVARAEIVYYNVNDSWAAPGAGNNRVYQTGVLDLPKDFGYVVTDCYLRLRSGSDIYAEGSAELQISPGGSLGPQFTVPLLGATGRQDGGGNTAIGSVGAGRFNAIVPALGSSSGAQKHAMVYDMRTQPSVLIYPFSSNSYTTDPNPASTFNLSVGEEIGNGNDIDVSIYLRFLQYDIDQSYNYVIQSPQLTR